MRNKKGKSNLKQTSNTWLLLGFFLIIFFLYQYIHLNVWATSNIHEYELFWFNYESTGASPLAQFFIIFVLLGIWSVLEIYSSIKLNYSDKYFCSYVCSTIILLILLIQTIFTKDVELNQFEYYLNSSKPLTFTLNEIPYIPIFTEWDHFKWDKHRSRRNFFVNFSNDDWDKLKNEFIKFGGSFVKEDYIQLYAKPLDRPRNFVIEIEWYNYL